ncbi:hypothetical protein K9O30_12775 [Clostridium bowmanii]|uniref:hypothetical protein n=1 Tax=Clostridium bowmanii TaxID=132925 RepID=UPI001C0B441C|nr:hypothetical protein [Clostridium bowmanii]MBU3189987.1 hypothetical protein [Clostridium bowmanii]MCA1074579.1 hypothetical protein [Clostridium bowmanii]
MYYRQDSEEYNEKNNTDSCNELDEYEELFINMPYYRQQTLNSPQYYQMVPFYPLMWNMQTIKGQDNKYRYKGNYSTEQNMPMKHMHMLDEEDEDLKMLYPKIYIRIQPIVKHHCDMMVTMYGTMYCPSKNEIDHICKEMCDNYEKHYRDDEDDDNLNDDEYKRQRRHFNRRRGNQDLIKILLIRELLGRRHGGGY